MKRIIAFSMGLLLCSMINLMSAQSVNASAVTAVRFDPATVTLHLGETFTVSVRIDDVVDLFGFEIQIGWNATLLSYVDHVVKVPVELSSDGVLHGPTFVVYNTVNSTAGSYRLSASSLGPAIPFDGSGIAFEMSFRVVYQPKAPQSCLNSSVTFLTDILVSTCACDIPHETYDCAMTIFCFDPADINHDWRIDILDIVLCAGYYGTTSLNPHWNPDCDLAEPFGVIDLLDIVTVASHYGEEWIWAHQG